MTENSGAVIAERRGARSHTVVLVLAGVAGLISAFAPLAAAAVVVSAASLLILWLTLGRLRLWRLLATATLTGYVVLNYGFTNLALPIALPVPVGYILAFLALGIAVLGHSSEVKSLLREPVVWCWLTLAGMSLLHLVGDVSTYGTYAIRDSSFVAEGVFLLLGFLWARSRGGVDSFVRVLAFLFAANLAYALTYHFSGLLQSISPVSGVFRDVPILGSYTHTPVFLILGALFYALLGARVTRWPLPVVAGLVITQAGWSLVFQGRSVYVAAVLAVLILAWLYSVRAAARIGAGIIVGVLLLLAATSIFGVALPGRLGTVSAEFLVQHFRSMFLEPDTPAVGSAQWRLQLIPEVLDRWLQTPSTVLVGEGFGQPLISHVGTTGVQTRQPHNTHLTVLARLGIVGLAVWIFMLARIGCLLVVGSLSARRGAPFDRSVRVWLTIFFAIGALLTTVQPWLEFSYGAVPFFTVIGFALGYLQECRQSAAEKRL